MNNCDFLIYFLKFFQNFETNHIAQTFFFEILRTITIDIKNSSLHLPGTDGKHAGAKLSKLTTNIESNGFF